MTSIPWDKKSNDSDTINTSLEKKESKYEPMIKEINILSSVKQEITLDTMGKPHRVTIRGDIKHE